MPYRSIANLPPRIREHLPLHAQEIFLEAFNHAWEGYASPSRRYPGSSLEEVAGGEAKLRQDRRALVTAG
jgi:cation transport regulator